MQFKLVVRLQTRGRPAAGIDSSSVKSTKAPSIRRSLRDRFGQDIYNGQCHERPATPDAGHFHNKNPRRPALSGIQGLLSDNPWSIFVSFYDYTSRKPITVDRYVHRKDSTSTTKSTACASSAKLPMSRKDVIIVASVRAFTTSDRPTTRAASIRVAANEEFERDAS